MRISDWSSDVFSSDLAEGVKITENDDWWADEVTLADPAQNRQRIAQAVEAATGADTIILNIGGNEQTSREAWADNHLGDRDDIVMVGQPKELFDALKEIGRAWCRERECQYV